MMPGSRLLDYIQYIAADMQVMYKLTSNAQQVGYNTVSLKVPFGYNFSDNNRFLNKYLDLGSESSMGITFPWKLIPFGMNSETIVTIPWNSVVPYWRAQTIGEQIVHGQVRWKVEAVETTENIPFTPIVQVFIRYVNVKYSGMLINVK